MKDQTLAGAKRTLRAFFADQDVRYLTAIVDGCRNGTFGFWNPCNCIRGLMCGGYKANKSLPALRAELALNYLQFNPGLLGIKEERREDLRRKVTLVIVLAEIRRRTKTATQVEAGELPVRQLSGKE